MDIPVLLYAQDQLTFIIYTFWQQGAVNTPPTKVAKLFLKCNNILLQFIFVLLGCFLSLDPMSMWSLANMIPSTVVHSYSLGWSWPNSAMSFFGNLRAVPLILADPLPALKCLGL